MNGKTQRRARSLKGALSDYHRSCDGQRSGGEIGIPHRSYDYIYGRDAFAGSHRVHQLCGRSASGRRFHWLGRQVLDKLAALSPGIRVLGSFCCVSVYLIV